MTNIDGYEYCGKYGKITSQFIEYKRSLGYKYTDRTLRAVRHLNNYLNAITPSNDDCGLTLDKKIVQGYTAITPGEKPETTAHRERLIRQFAMYLNAIGIPAYIAPVVKRCQGSFVPYIFTKEQIAALLTVADNLKYDYRSPHYHHVYPFLIRLLYCCGLRLGEALRLRIEDIDFSERLLRIEQSKFNNSRLLPMSESLYLALQKYMGLLGFSQFNKGFLFRTIRNAPYSQSTIRTRYKSCLNAQGYQGLQMVNLNAYMMSGILFLSMLWNQCMSKEWMLTVPCRI
jgi:Site-specific recombinase XerD